MGRCPGGGLCCQQSYVCRGDTRLVGGRALGQGWGGGLCTQVQAKLSGIPRRRAAHSRNSWNQGSSAPSGRVIGDLLFGKTKHLL